MQPTLARALGHLFLFVILSAPLSAQSQSTDPRAPHFASTRFEGLFVDAPDCEGAVWARGTTYKIGFENGVARYIPLFGPSAPRNFPIALELRAVRCGDREIDFAKDPVARVDGRRVRFERGAIVEAWDLAPESAEQSFVLEAPIGSGELVFGLALRTELDLVRASVQELVFGRAGLGEVHYGEAIAIDARGKRTPLELALVGDALEIRVPAACAETAAYPLIVDPILRTFAVDTANTDTTEPDAAYDATNDVWLVVCRERISQTDSDIRCHRYSGDGLTRRDTIYAESGTGFAHSPSVASNAAADRFLVVWGEAGTLDFVRCRERHASSTTQENTRIIFPGDLTRIVGATDVGGASSGSNRFLVVFTLTDPSFAVPDHSVMGAGYTVGGTVLPPAPISSFVNCGAAPRVSKDSGVHRRWMVTWTQNTISPCGGDEILFAIVSDAFLVVQNRTPLPLPLTGRDVRPAAAGDGESFFLVWQRDDAVPRTQSDIVGARIARRGASWIQNGPVVLLSHIEPGVALGADQTGPSIGFDGCRYVYAYSEATSGGVPRPFAATFVDAGTSPLFHEGHVPLSNAASGVAHSSVKIATQHNGGGTPGGALAIWQQIGNGGRDLSAALLDIRSTSGGVTRIETGCPNRAIATSIGSTGVPALGRELRVFLGNVQGTPLLMIGAPSPPLPLCTTATSSCELGVALPPFLVLPAAEVSLTVPCDALLLRGTVAFQGLDLGAGLGCPAALFGVPFRVTDTLNFTIQ